MSARREAVTVRRPVCVELVPHGAPVELAPGMIAHITQALGTNFTLLVEGQLVRLKGSDADAIGKPVPAPVVPGVGAGEDLEKAVWQTLSTCYDPEIPVDIVALGLVYRCELMPMSDQRTRVEIDMTLTAPGCGMGELIAEEVADKVLALAPVGEVKVDLVFDPPWDRSRMSEAAQLALGL
jgi:probable FeS assembly SUF system protein SufT